MFKTTLAVCLSLLVLAGQSVSEPGMWMPHQMPMLDLETQGLEMDPSLLYKPDGTGLMSAVVYLGGGTGEFVSDSGLILTNHHVAYTAIQRASTEENNYLENGFYACADSGQTEIPAQGYLADILIGYWDVTDSVLAGVTPEMTPLERYEAIERSKKRLTANAEEGHTDIRARVAASYSGNRYDLYLTKRLRDIRLVYAPPTDLGRYGGEEDNWMWPRHTADFSFLRAYVAPDGSGATYSPDNVPYRPKSFFTLSRDGVQPGDFTFVMGYPAITYRNLAAAEVRFEMDRMKSDLDMVRDYVDFFTKVTQKSEALAIKYAAVLRGYENAMKNYVGKLEGMDAAHILEKKTTDENEMIETLDRETYRQAQARMDSLMQQARQHTIQMSAINSLVNRYEGPELLHQAHLILRTVMERQKPDLEREVMFQERNIPYIEERIRLSERSYDVQTDQKLFQFLLERLQTKAPEHQPELFRPLLESVVPDTLETYAAELYGNTRLTDPQFRLNLLSYTPAQLLQLNDPLINLVRQIESSLKDFRLEDKKLTQQRRDVRGVLIQGMLTLRNGNLAPDANRTIRFTSGHVKGYHPRDAVYYEPITSLSGVIEKDRGEDPFDVPDALTRLYESNTFGPYKDADLNDVPVCFLNTTTVTGGNSGSPTLDANGDLVGVIFDMTYESVIGDYYIIPSVQRTISVDIRYVLYLLDYYSHATALLNELHY
jgi:hypothetical protein